VGPCERGRVPHSPFFCLNERLNFFNLSFINFFYPLVRIIKIP